MKLIKFFFVLLLFYVHTALAQSDSTVGQGTGSIKGRLVDSTGNESLRAALVMVVDAQDSVVAKGVVVSHGAFEIDNIPVGAYTLVSSFQQFDSLKYNIIIVNRLTDLGNIKLHPKSATLDAVIVKQSVINMKKDTAQFNAASFPTKPNSLTSDLLNKLPGVEVGSDGSIKAHGEAVQRVMVNGKRYFGDDPLLATKNLPPDMIDKIQIFDDMSDRSKATGVDDGTRIKTINIILKKGKSNAGNFGRVVLGGGFGKSSDDNQEVPKFDEQLSLQHLDGDRQLSILGQANNDNKQNFSPQQLTGVGSRRFNPSTGAGVTNTYSVGANYADICYTAKGHKIDVGASGFFNQQATDITQTSTTQNILNVDSSTYNNQFNVSTKQNSNSRANINIGTAISKHDTLVFRTDFSTQGTTNNVTNDAIMVNTKGDTLYTSQSKLYNTSSGYNFNNINLQITHKFALPRRTLTIALAGSGGVANGHGSNFAKNTFYQPSLSVTEINQISHDSSTSLSVNPSITYTEPIGKHQTVQLDYDFFNTHSTTVDNAYAYNTITNKYDILAVAFSNAYNNTVTANKGTFTYRYVTDKYNFDIGSGVQHANQTSINITRNNTIVRDYWNLLPTANLNYQFDRTHNIRISYSGRNVPPAITQLQDLTTTSDSINFQKGNPNLRFSYTQTIRLRFHAVNPETQFAYFGMLNLSNTSNDIQNSIVQTADGKRTTTYVNLSGTYNLFSFLGMNIPFTRPKSNLFFGIRPTFTRAASLVQGAENWTQNTTLGDIIRWTTTLKKNLDFNITSNTNYVIARQSLRPTANANYFTQEIILDGTAYTNSGWLVACALDYTYTSIAAGYNASVPLLNPAIAKQLFKQKQGEIRLSVVDLLNANKNVSRSVSLNQIASTRSSILTQYFLLTFTYNIGKQPKQQPQQDKGLFDDDAPNQATGNGGGRRAPSK